MTAFHVVDELSAGVVGAELSVDALAESQLSSE